MLKDFGNNMAIMYPQNIDIYSPTKSERIIYNVLEKGLSDSYQIFYSVKWYSIENGVRQNSECDFLIFNPSYGYLCMEVKGGEQIHVENNEWKLKLKNGTRNLRESPYSQAEKSMYFFKKYYEDECLEFYQGIFGYVVSFPLYTIDGSLATNAPKNLTIDMKDLKDISKKVKEVFSYWRGVRKNKSFFSESQKEKFLNCIKKRISLSIAAGSLIEHQENQFKLLNEQQGEFLSFIREYKKVYICGGAGTGKSWLSYKKWFLEKQKQKEAAVVIPDEILKEFYKKINSDIQVFTYSELIIINRNFDSLIVDEGQDFSKEMSNKVISFLKNKESILYVFLDLNQNVKSIEWDNNFSIIYPPFYLKRNVRNTSRILEWTKEKTELLIDSFPMSVQGIYPEKIFAKTKYNLVKNLEKIINNLYKEGVDINSIVILSDKDYKQSKLSEISEISKWKISQEVKLNNLRFSTIKKFKGLESNVVIFLNHFEATDIELYIAYTRAKFYLYEIIVE
ncbi:MULTISPECIES: NERD domain-containing protein [Psychrilyobacter]|nr:MULTISPECIES: NERD domain-containing protein [Psychrilyobacter]MCS5421729.1 NERD domain-containing protein [Psychrilyobacter sp. S5]NDI77164.1 hypothetical protein [Psychrilyobacter piezotolerans]